MRETVAKCVVAMSAGFALMVAQGCKKQAAPARVQPVVSSAAQVQPDFAVGSLPVEDVDPGAIPRVDRTARRRSYVPLVQAQSADAQAAAVAAEQRRQDARLLQQQQATSQQQQEELNQDIEQTLKMQREMEAEPRIQDVPELPPQPAAPEPTQPQ